MKKILTVFETRAEAIKMCPLINVLILKSDFNIKICIVGQHIESVEGVTDFFEITPDYYLPINKDEPNLFDLTIIIIKNIKAILEKEKPDLVLVQGDTSTSFITALACFYMKVPIGHIGAGLRTYDIQAPYPEEFNRQALGIMATYNFVPTRRAKINLINEGKDPTSIFITGTTAIDTLKRTIQSRYTHPLLEWAKDSRLLIVTVQNQENIENNLMNFCQAVKRIVEEIPDTKVIFSIRLYSNYKDMAEELIGKHDKIHLTSPLPLFDFHNLLNHSVLILTDSEGIQDEAPSLGKPVLVLKDNIDRPEGIQAGTLKMVGTEEENIIRNCKWLLSDSVLYQKMSKGFNPYGDGYASERIADIIQTGRRWEWNENSLNYLDLNYSKRSKWDKMTDRAAKDI